MDASNVRKFANLTNLLVAACGSLRDSYKRPLNIDNYIPNQN